MVVRFSWGQQQLLCSKRLLDLVNVFGIMQ